MFKRIDRRAVRHKRHLRARKNIIGSTERPRLCVTRTLNHIYAQIIDDVVGNTLASASTLEADIKGKIESGCNIEAAKAVGTALAQKAKAAGINQVVFDRGGNIYHGRIKALAEAAREAGLKF